MATKTPQKTTAISQQPENESVCIPVSTETEVLIGNAIGKGIETNQEPLNRIISPNCNHPTFPQPSDSRMNKNPFQHISGPITSTQLAWFKRNVSDKIQNNICKFLNVERIEDLDSEQAVDVIESIDATITHAQVECLQSIVKTLFDKEEEYY